MQADLIQMWLDSVAVSHSGAVGTQIRYRNEIEAFLKFAGTTPEGIVADYNGMGEREFKQKYAQLLKSYLGSLMRMNYAPGSISNFVYGVLSFFKHNDLPIGYVPPVRYRAIFHNRDIEAEEIVKILQVSAPRERAFFTFMAQSGLRPTTICNLRLKHIEPDFSSGKSPCLVNVPEELTKGQYHGYITFIGEEAVKHLKEYFNTPGRRGKLSKNSYLFVNQGSEEPMVFNTVSGMFRKAARTLKEKGEMDFEQKQADRPAEIRLYNLRKFFRKMANQAGFENVEYWMGHTVGVDASYRPRDPEFYRKIYAEKAMPFLRFESPTPNETQKEIAELRSTLEKQQKMIDYQNLQLKFASIKDRMERADVYYDVAALKDLLKQIKDEIEPSFQKNRVDWLEVTDDDDLSCFWGAEIGGARNSIEERIRVLEKNQAWQASVSAQRALYDSADALILDHDKELADASIKELESELNKMRATLGDRIHAIIKEEREKIARASEARSEAEKTKDTSTEK